MSVVLCFENLTICLLMLCEMVWIIVILIVDKIAILTLGQARSQGGTKGCRAPPNKNPVHPQIKPVHPQIKPFDLIFAHFRSFAALLHPQKFSSGFVLALGICSMKHTERIQWELKLGCQ